MWPVQREGSGNRERKVMGNSYPNSQRYKSKGVKPKAGNRNRGCKTKGGNRNPKLNYQ
jgi:hypothetical protein